MRRLEGVGTPAELVFRATSQQLVIHRPTTTKQMRGKKRRWEKEDARETAGGERLDQNIRRGKLKPTNLVRVEKGWRDLFVAHGTRFLVAHWVERLAGCWVKRLAGWRAELPAARREEPNAVRRVKLLVARGIKPLAGGQVESLVGH